MTIPTPSSPDSKTPTAPARFQILSLDGGGIKGLFTAAVLAAIEDDLKTRIVDHFDLVAGTSTGGIIALGLGLGLRPKEIVEFYVKEGPRIFSGPSWFRSLRHAFFNKYPALPIEAALQRCFGTRTFGESEKRLVIPCYNLGEDAIYLFRTPHLERLRRDYKVPAWQVARATSAAPTYFPVARHVDNLRLVDGGVWANNPALVALVEANEPNNLNIPMGAIHVLSIGTSTDVVRRPGTLDRGGLFRWGASAAAVDVIMRGQSVGVTNQMRFLLGKDRFERLDPIVPARSFSLDGVHSADELLAKAAHHSRQFTPVFAAKFAGHSAPRFNPLH